MPLLADTDAEREALQSTAYPVGQTFCQKHGLMSVRGNCPTVPHCLSVRERGCATRAVTRALCLEGPCASVTPRRLKVFLKKESGGVVATGTAVSTGGTAKY